jgi:hypothetical protein
VKNAQQTALKVVQFSQIEKIFKNLLTTIQRCGKMVSQSRSGHNNNKKPLKKFFKKFQETP